MTGWVLASSSIVERAVGFVFCSVVIAAGAVPTAIRFARSRRSREEQVNRVVSMLDGRRTAYLSKIETSLDPQVLARLAHSRGYFMADHRFGKYYQFVYAWQQAPPGRPGPW
jgi:hypothetical protein